MLKESVSLDDHFTGNLNAPHQLVEYGDYECSYCGQAYPIVKEVKKYFGDQLCFVFRNFPLAEIHPHAELAAESAEFAAAYDRFWEMHNLLYENQDRLSQEFILELVTALELPKDDFILAIEKRIYLPKVKADFLGGVRSGVNGTPTFFINGQRHNGSYEYEELILAIEKDKSENRSSYAA